MPFHVRLQRWLRTEDAFNLSEQEVRERFVDAWRRGEPIIIRGRTWVPRQATISIREGPALTSSQRSWGQGWMKAHEVGEDVTDRFLHSVASDHVSAAASTPDEATGALDEDDSSRQAPTKGALHAFLFGSGTRIGVTATVIVGLIGVVVTIIIATSTSGGAPEIVTSSSAKTEIVTS